jgi:Domain of unknown function (DUF4326)
MPKVQRIEIVQARTKGVTGYVNLGRPGPFGNPFNSVQKGDKRPNAIAFFRKEDVKNFDFLLRVAYHKDAVLRRKAILALLDRETESGTLTIACPCNGVFKGQPCHATVIKEFLDAELARRQNGASS